MVLWFLWAEKIIFSSRQVFKLGITWDMTIQIQKCKYRNKNTTANTSIDTSTNIKESELKITWDRTIDITALDYCKHTNTNTKTKQNCKYKYKTLRIRIPVENHLRQDNWHNCLGLLLSRGAQWNRPKLPVDKANQMLPLGMNATRWVVQFYGTIHFLKVLCN